MIQKGGKRGGRSLAEEGVYVLWIVEWRRKWVYLWGWGIDRMPFSHFSRAARVQSINLNQGPCYLAGVLEVW